MAALPDTSICVDRRVHEIFERVHQRPKTGLVETARRCGQRAGYNITKLARRCEDYCMGQGELHHAVPTPCLSRVRPQFLFFSLDFCCQACLQADLKVLDLSIVAGSVEKGSNLYSRPRDLTKYQQRIPSIAQSTSRSWIVYPPATLPLHPHTTRPYRILRPTTLLQKIELMCN